MEPRLLLKDELESVAKAKGLFLINGEIDINSETSNQIEIPNQTEFMNFYQHLKTKILFYFYIYVDQEAYLISNNYHEKYNEAIQKELLEEFKNYNQSVMNIDFNKPASLFMYYIQDGFLFFNYSDRKEIADLPVNDDKASLIVEELVDQLSEEKVKKIKEKAQDDKNKKEQELKDVIFSDPDFKTATNLDFRREFTKKFLENRPEAKEFLSYAGYISPMHFIEKIWKEFKGKGLHK
ncbi:hypothetical protein Q7A53_09065 [Halobacillus rhizosphaerae]|uniref:hypothetical protein n=1 Tax=Halobacillus rhizosphaerae TaxID=3064889 RepID=UPI00398B5F64